MIFNSCVTVFNPTLMAHNNKHKYKPYWNKQKYSRRLEPGSTGFLCTCNGKFREKECLREAYNVLNEFADELFGSQQVEDKKNSEAKLNEMTSIEDDVEGSLAKEVEMIRAEERNKHVLRRFQVVESGANGIIFIKTTVPDPVKLAHTIVSSYAKGVQKSKFLLRLLPVEVTCKAYLDEISHAIEPLLEKYFSGESKTFAIVFNHRNNDRLKRDEVIEKLAELVSQRNILHRADLKQPQLAILLEVIRSVCCISIIPEYFTLKKYNLLENSTRGLEMSRDNSNGEEAEEKEGRLEDTEELEN